MSAMYRCFVLASFIMLLCSLNVRMSVVIVNTSTAIYYTVKPVNKGHLRERQGMAFIDRWPLFGGNFVIF